MVSVEVVTPSTHKIPLFFSQFSDKQISFINAKISNNDNKLLTELSKMKFSHEKTWLVASFN